MMRCNEAIKAEKSSELVQFHQVSLSFNHHDVLANMSFTLKAGSKLALLGQSGLGKSSILKLIAGLVTPSQGQVVNHAQRIGYVFQEPRLLPWLTVQENIYQVLKASGVAKREAEQRIKALLAQVGLLACINHYPHQLSGGMAQRVALVRAFAVKPDLLLLDEPFSALDTPLASQLTELLAKLLTPQTSMIYVSHNIEQVLPLTELALVLKTGNDLDWHSVANKEERAIFLNQFYRHEVY